MQTSSQHNNNAAHIKDVTCILKLTELRKCNKNSTILNKMTEFFEHDNYKTAQWGKMQQPG